MTMKVRTLNLIKCIDSGSIVWGNLVELAKLAELNKVLLGFLRRIGYEGYLRAKEEKRFRQYIIEVAELLNALNNLDCALFKFRKPVEHVSVDIDILVRSEHLPKTLKKLARMGFRMEVLEPYTVTMVRGGVIVDLYTHPSFAWIVYLDGERLLEETETIELGEVGAEARALTKEAEAIVTAAHAIYKEHIYLLSDYYVTKRWLNGKAMKLAEELNAREAVLASLKLNDQIERGLAETPIRLNPARTTMILSAKFIKDPNFRATSINAVKLIAKRRSVLQLIQRLGRKTY